MLGFLCYIFMWIVTSCVMFKTHQCSSEDLKDIVMCTIMGLNWWIVIPFAGLLILFKFIFRMVEKLG